LKPISARPVRAYLRLSNAPEMQLSFPPSTVTDEALWNDRNFLLMAISAGYFGADAIEGILGKHAPGDQRRYRFKKR